MVEGGRSKVLAWLVTNVVGRGRRETVLDRLQEKLFKPGPEEAHVCLVEKTQVPRHSVHRVFFLFKPMIAAQLAISLLLGTGRK